MVGFEEGEGLAAEIGAKKYVECSALTRVRRRFFGRFTRSAPRARLPAM